MDNNLTLKIQEWLDTPVSERNVPAGAELLLKLNRNRILYHNIIHRGERMMGKLEYELKKYLRMRIDNKTVADVVRLEKEILPKVQKFVEEEEPANKAEHAGKRADHDELPPEIQALWDGNFEQYAKVKALFEELKAMMNMEPCDRYEKLKLLDEAESKYRKNLADYDAYLKEKSFPKDGESEDDQEDNFTIKTEDPVELATKINNSRKYISSNKDKLAALIEKDQEKAEALRAKMQERVDTIQSAGVAFTPDQQTELESLGIIFK